MEVKQVLGNRRSIRYYLPFRPVERHKIQARAVARPGGDTGGLRRMSPTRSFTDMEQIICTTAQMTEEHKLYFVAIGGPPMVAVLLAKRLYSP